MIVRIDVKGQCYEDVEWEHNHSVETLEASNFRDLSFECIEKVNKLSESGHTHHLLHEKSPIRLVVGDAEENCK